MPIPETIESLAKMAVVTDSHDFPAIVALQDRLSELIAEIDSDDLEPLAEVAGHAVELLGDIVMHTIDDTESAFRLVQQSIEYAQELMHHVEDGGTAPRSPFAPEEANTYELADDYDEELFLAWVEGTGHAFTELEGLVVGLDSSEDPEESIAEIRRAIHTLKGESGVFALHSAQSLLHEAETLIDYRSTSGEEFPVDEILAVSDWTRSYIAALVENAQAPVPEHASLLRALQESGTVVNSDEESTEEAPVVENNLEDSEGSDQPVPTNSMPPSESTPVATEKVIDESPSPESEPQSSSESNYECPSDPVGIAPTDDPMFTDTSPVEFPESTGMDDMLSEFIGEAREHIAAGEESLLTLEDDLENIDHINTIFRSFHTIKGVAGFLNLQAVVTLAHEAETLLDFARNGEITLNSRYLDLILASCDMLTQIIGALEDGDPPTKGEHASMIHRLKQATLDQLDDEENSAVVPEIENAVPLGDILVDLHLATEQEINDALNRQAECADRLKTILQDAELFNVEAVERSLTAGGDTGQLIGRLLVDLALVDKENLAHAIEESGLKGMRLGEILGLSTKEIASALHEQRKVNREELPSEAAVVEAKPQPAQPPQSDSTAPRVAPKPAPPAPQAKKKPGKKKKIDQTVKVSTGRMDNLVTMVGELVIAQQMVIQDDIVKNINNQRLQRNFTQVEKIIRDLQEVSMALRMVTVRATFQKMARLVRDVSAKAGKKIKFVMEGEDTELDRNVVEEIGDPLVHMIRNSCDHGIGTPEQRRAQGKPEQGIITIRAFHQGGSIVIEVEDDGRGLDRDKLIKKAIEKGILPADQNPADLSDAEAHNLVFKPGFSTAEKVTDISGRGVGMDVVRRNIESLRGKAEIRSTLGKGSTFSMRLPLTMAIIDGMIVRVGSERYVIPTLAIEQSFRPAPEDIHTVVDKGEMASVRGGLLPIYRLHRVFQVDNAAHTFADSILIVLETNKARCCLLVDDILGQQQVVIKTLGEGLSNIHGVSGGAILGDGKVALIIDVDGLVNQATQNTQSAPLLAAA